MYSDISSPMGSTIMPAHAREQRHILRSTLLFCASFSQELIRIINDVQNIYVDIHDTNDT